MVSLFSGGLVAPGYFGVGQQLYLHHPSYFYTLFLK